MVELPTSAVQGGGEEAVPSAWSIRLRDRQVCRQSSKFEADWRRFWNAVNILQFGMPLAICSCEDIALRSAVETDASPSLARLGGASVAAEPVSIPADGALPQDEVLDLYLEEERPVVLMARELGIPLPTAGFELEGASGRCIAEAALAWPEVQCAVLVDASSQEVTAFERAGWSVFLNIGDAKGICASVQRVLVQE